MILVCNSYYFGVYQVVIFRLRHPFYIYWLRFYSTTVWKNFSSPYLFVEFLILCQYDLMDFSLIQQA